MIETLKRDNNVMREKAQKMETKMSSMNAAQKEQEHLRHTIQGKFLVLFFAFIF
jgi:hypothetical protein